MIRHRVEFDPVFSERMRKVGGDKAAGGFLAAEASSFMTGAMILIDGGQTLT